MSTAKRSRQRQADPGATSTPPPAKRAKFSKQEQPSSLAFLTDERQRSGKVLGAQLTDGVDTTRTNSVKDTNAVVPHQVDEDAQSIEVEDAGEVASDDEISTSSEEPSSDSESDVEPANQPAVNGTSHIEVDEDEPETMEEDTDGKALVIHEEQQKDFVMTNGTKDDEAEDEEEAGDTGAPSFGELLEQAHPDVIDVAASFPDPDSSRALVTTNANKSLRAPAANSLGTVLSQALRTNDKELLESCLQTKDNGSIKSTIQRLQSNSVAILMQKLAERLHKRPGRASSLMVWIQWSLIAHGAYLATQPALVKQLRSLRQVVRERANSLQHLITLKGKLDMLSAQVELRRSMRGQQGRDSDSDEDEADVVFVEGQDDDFSSSEDEADESTSRPMLQHRQKAQQAIEAPLTNGTKDDALDDDIELINGVDDDAEMESLADGDGDESGDEVNGFIDDEAEESDDGESMSSEDEGSASGSGVEDEEDDDVSGSSSEEEAPPPRTARAAKRNALIRKR